ncbi:NADH-quinone oxidoreductase subunit J family protein [Geochorda subterranea]|uniref:NADH-quinone oxidoreductase subunit J n=1 Tax=Geochorda subterranea TaxID=3109564 RepID=A0ABZ1BM06_9FIRM|nr:NADH-quinone oxidoreductase subunit J [Limnochorda sp. LNt]WRP13605.1 NADH-quinone oxidoreductase subunit J [Limnochorda sp. LNt]
MTLLFVAASAVAIAGALGVVAARTPVHGVLAMLANFAGLSALFLSLQAEFMAVAQIIVYAGAVMVLFLFVISLLSARNRPTEGPEDRLWGQLPAGVATAAVVVAGLVMAVGGPSTAVGGPPASWPPVPEGFGGVEAFGRVLLTAFPFELELAGLVLLVALVGVMVLVGRRVETVEPHLPSSAEQVPATADAGAGDGRVPEPVGVAVTATGEATGVKPR